MEYSSDISTTIHHSRVAKYEYLNLVNKKEIIISEFYHQNYHELKNEISKKVDFLGNRPVNIISEIKGIFQ